MVQAHMGNNGRQFISVGSGVEGKDSETSFFKDLTGLKMVRYLAPKFIGKLACGHVGNKVGG
jgi:hypothetical protein